MLIFKLFINYIHQFLSQDINKILQFRHPKFGPLTFLIGHF